MHCHRTVICLAVCLFAIVFIACVSQPIPAGVQASAARNQARPAGGPPPPAAGAPCGDPALNLRRFDVELHINGESDTVTVRPDRVPQNPKDPPVKRGECIHWEVVVDGQAGAVAPIHKIHFMNSRNDGAKYGKAPNKTPVADDCIDIGPSCMIIITLPDGTYSYAAHVAHQGKDKHSDPIIVISGDGRGMPPVQPPPPPPR